MKSFLSKWMAIFAISFMGFKISEAQLVIKVRPVYPVAKIHPVRPGPRHTWIPGEYAYRGNQYIYTEGYWAVPPPRYTFWKEGHWRKARGGWMWVPGHWK